VLCCLLLLFRWVPPFCSLYRPVLYCCRTRAQGRAWVVVRMLQGGQGWALPYPYCLAMVAPVALCFEG
jgi:hypothetical protein